MNQPKFPTIPTAYITQDFGNLRPDLYSGDHRHTGSDRIEGVSWIMSVRESLPSYRVVRVRFNPELGKLMVN